MSVLHEAFSDSAVLEELKLGAILFDSSMLVCGWKGFLAQGLEDDPRLHGKLLVDALTPYFLSRKERDEFLSALSGALLEPGKTAAWNIEAKFPGLAGKRFRAILKRGEPNQLLLKPIEAAEMVRDRYERIFDSTPDGIMVIDTGRRVRLVNKATGELLGRNPRDVLQNNCVCGQLVNCHLADGTSLDSQLCPAMDLFSADATFQRETMLATNSRGEERWIETTYSPIRNDQGEVEFVIGILRDVHERLALEQRVRQSEKLASLGELTAAIAHEIKNPLGILLSSVEIILNPSRPQEMKQEAAEFIRDEVKRLDDRLRSFLKFARPSSPRQTRIDLNEFLRRFFRERDKEREYQTMLQFAAPLPAVLFDEDQLQQVVMNLYVNCMEAGGQCVRIMVQTGTTESGVFMEIHDGGPGIPEENLPKVFNPFFTTDASGTGLGLSTVHQYVSANGGTIEVGTSPKLGGAMFRLEFSTQARA